MWEENARFFHRVALGFFLLSILFLVLVLASHPSGHAKATLAGLTRLALGVSLYMSAFLWQYGELTLAKLAARILYAVMVVVLMRNF